MDREGGKNRLVVGYRPGYFTPTAKAERNCSCIQRCHTYRRISSPVVLGRDHHDVSGTIHPSVKLQTYTTVLHLLRIWLYKCDRRQLPRRHLGLAATTEAEWAGGEVINGGFGMLLDGSPSGPPTAFNASLEVNNGISAEHGHAMMSHLCH